MIEGGLKSFEEEEVSIFFILARADTDEASLIPDKSFFPLFLPLCTPVCGFLYLLGDLSRVSCKWKWRNPTERALVEKSILDASNGCAIFAIVTTK